MIDAPTDQFAVFYLVLVAVTLPVAVAAGYLFERWPTSTDDEIDLDTYEAAYLAGGPIRVLHAALGSLAQRDAVRLRSDGLIQPGPSLPRSMTAAESAVWTAIRSGAGRPYQLYRSCPAVAAECADAVRGRGLCGSDRERLVARLVPSAIALAPAVVALIRLSHRVAEHRPVALLVAVAAVPTLLSVAIAGRPIRTGRAGHAMLRAMRRRHAVLADIGGRASASMPYPKVAKAVALFGAGALRHSQLKRLADLLAPPPSPGGDAVYSDSAGDGGDGHDGGGHHGGGGLGDAF